MYEYKKDCDVGAVTTKLTEEHMEVGNCGSLIYAHSVGALEHQTSCVPIRCAFAFAGVVIQLVGVERRVECPK